MKSSSFKPRTLILTSMVVSVMVAVLLCAGRVASSKSSAQTPPSVTAQTSSGITGDQAPVTAVQTGTNVHPRALVSKDFDLDGAPDLAIGYTSSDRGIVGVRRGNPNVYAPKDESALKAIQNGQMQPSLLAGMRVFDVPEKVDMLATGDFDGDGDFDLISGANNGGLYLLAGNGAGDFATARKLEIGGALTALASNPQKVAVGVNGPAGPQLLVFDGNGADIFSNEPEQFPLPSPPSSIVIGKLDRDSGTDIAVATGNQLTLVHGAETAASTTSPITIDGSDSMPWVETIPLGFEARFLSFGQFVWNRESLKQLAVMGADGAVRIVSQNNLDTRPYTAEEETANGNLRDLWEEVGTGEADAPVMHGAPVGKMGLSGANDQSGWTVGAAVSSGDGEVSGASPLLASDQYNDGAKKLLMLDRAGHRILSVSNVASAPAKSLTISGESQQAILGDTPVVEDELAVENVADPVAFIEMPQKPNGTRDLVIADNNLIEPSVSAFVVNFVISVDRTDDNASASACTGAANDCSLRGAITFANSHVGTQINIPINGTYNLTIAGVNEESNATGDLDVIASDTAIVGNGPGNTIINQTVGDRVFDINPLGTANRNYSITGVTISGGQRNATVGKPAGGGILCGADGNVLTFNNILFTGNQVTSTLAGNGGAIAQSSFSGSTDAGDATVTNCTFTNNSVQSGVGGAYRLSGGSGSPSATMTGCTFNNNQATTNGGGALFLTSTGPATFQITKSTFTNNIAKGATAGGAISKANGTLTVSFSRFYKNSNSSGGDASTASAVSITGNDNVTLTNNWWSCNVTPLNALPASGCDSLNTTAQTVPYTTTVDPRLVLTHTASPAPIVTGQDTTLTASFKLNSSNQDVSANINVLLGLPISFLNPVRGNLSGAQSTIQPSGTATANFRASQAGAGSADAKVDNGTATASFTINKADTTAAITSHLPAPTVTGQPFTVAYSVAVNPPGSSSPTVPTGNVTVSDGVNSCTASLAAGQCTLTLFTAGNRTLTAQYAGDANFNGHTSAGVSHIVNKADTTTTIQSDNPDPSVTGQSVAVAYSVTVNSPGSGTPTGNVLVSDGTNSCTGTVAAGTCNIVFTSAGSKTITATYQGDANYNASPASAGASHTVNKANTTAAITSDNPDPSVVGQSVAINFTVAVTAPGAGTPTGNVLVSDGTDSCTATVAAGMCSITFNTAGPRTLTATYQGDVNFNASAASPGQSHTVNKAATTTAITSDSPDPSVVGESVTVNYTVTVNAPGAGTPTGNVVVSDGVNSCTGTVAAGSCSFALFTAGSRPLTASYQGDSNFLVSTSASAPHLVSKANTTITITSDSPDPSLTGQAVAVNFSVSVVGPGAGTPTGNVVVTVNDPSGDTCTGTVASGTCNLTLTTAGTKTLTATYVGDSNYNGSADTESHEAIPPIQFAINDASVVRPTSSNVSMLFTVTLTQPAQSMVTVAYQTANDSGGANPGVAGTDYIADSGTVTFNTGEQFKLIAITIPPNPSATGDKTFLVNLSSPSQGIILDGQAKGTIKETRPQSTALITEVRTSGPAGADDDFVEVYNNTDSPINVASTDGSAGWAVVKMGASCSDTPVIIGTIPNGTIIPARGHYLFTGTSYSLTGYVLGDSTLSINIDSDANLALFTVADLAKLSTDNKLDGVGFGANTGGICDLLRNGNTLPVTQGSTAEHSFVKKDLGPVIDTGDNQADFTLVAVSQAATIGNGTTPALGAPGPQNLQSPITRNGYLTPGLISPGLSPNVAPNRVRVQGTYNYTDPITSQSITFPFGTIAVRRSYTNNTGQNMTALRFRIVIITAGGPIPAGTADVRAISSLPEIVNVNGSDITVQGTTLQQTPNQPEGGGLNATLGCCRLTGGTVAGERTVSLGQPLSPGQTISVQWLLGVKQTGNFQFYVNIEGLP